MSSSCSVWQGRVSIKQTIAVLTKSRIMKEGSGFIMSTKNGDLTLSGTIQGPLEELVI